jgi:hypothetical protein
MFTAIRYYWIIAKGYRLNPWKSPYIRWRLETYFGKEAADLDARGYFRLVWREFRHHPERLRSFLHWVDERWREQKQ